MVRRTLVVALLAGVLLLPAAPAGAQLSAFTGTATGVAGELRIAGQTFRIGFTEAKVQSGPTSSGCATNSASCAVAAAASPPVGTRLEVAAPSDPGPETAQAVDIPPLTGPLAGIIDGRLGLATAVARPAPNPSAEAGAATAIVDVTLNQAILNATPGLENGIRTALDAIAAALEPRVAGDASGRIGRLIDVAETLAEDPTAAPLFRLTTGASAADTEKTAETATAVAVAETAVLVLAPTAQTSTAAATPEGLAVIEIGEAGAAVATDGRNPAADAEEATVRVRSIDPVTGQDLTADLSAALPEACVAEETPLETCIERGGSDETVQDGGAAAVVSPVVISALPTSTSAGLVEVRLSSVDVGVNAARGPADPEPRDNLPRTGGGATPVALALLAAGGGLALLARRRRA